MEFLVGVLFLVIVYQQMRWKYLLQRRKKEREEGEAVPKNAAMARASEILVQEV